MSCKQRPTIRFVLMLLASAAAASAGLLQPLPAAAQPRVISPFDSPVLQRRIHGNERSFDLSAGGRDFGRAEAFFGVDALSNRGQQYLTSGVQWRSAAAGVPLLQLAALRTEGRGNTDSGQTLLRARSALDLGGRWYMPDITTEFDQSDNTNRAAVQRRIGHAARIGVANTLGTASYRLDYFQATREFSAMGSAIDTDDRGVELHTQYDLGDRWSLSNNVAMHQLGTGGRTASLVHRWILERRNGPIDIGSPWRLSAQLGRIGANPTPDRTPIAVQLQTRTAQWRSWHLNSALGWYDNAVATPGDLPVAGAMWQVSASHRLDLVGLQARLSPSFSVGGSRYETERLASRTGLALGFPRLSDNLNLRVNYLSAGWSARAGDADLEMMLSFSQSVASILPGLSTTVRGLRLPWERRY